MFSLTLTEAILVEDESSATVFDRHPIRRGLHTENGKVLFEMPFQLMPDDPQGLRRVEYVYKSLVLDECCKIAHAGLFVQVGQPQFGTFPVLPTFSYTKI